MKFPKTMITHPKITFSHISADKLARLWQMKIFFRFITHSRLKITLRDMIKNNTNAIETVYGSSNFSIFCTTLSIKSNSKTHIVLFDALELKCVKTNECAHASILVTSRLKQLLHISHKFFLVVTCQFSIRDFDLDSPLSKLVFSFSCRNIFWTGSN